MPRQKPDGYQEFPKAKYHRTGKSVVVNNEDEEAALGEGWGDSPGGPPGLPVGSDPLHWCDTWDLGALGLNAMGRIKAGLAAAHADVIESSRQNGSKIRRVSMQKAFDLLAQEYFSAGLLTDSLLTDSIPLMVYDAAVAGGWQTGTPERNIRCTVRYGHYWVPKETPAMLQNLFEPQRWRWRGKLSGAKSGLGDKESAENRGTEGPARIAGSPPETTRGSVNWDSAVACEAVISAGTQPQVGGSQLKWEDIEICFLSEQRIQIFTRGTPAASLNFAELGFEDRRGRGGKPDLAWGLLRELSARDGRIQASSVSGNQQIQKRAGEIRRRLCQYFRTTENPLPFLEGIGYQTRFKITRSRAYDT